MHATYSKALGDYLPWTFLIIAAGIGLAGNGEAAGKTSAYLAATGLGVMLMSYFLGRLANRLSGN